MEINAIKSDIRAFKMDTGGHFVTEIKWHINMKWVNIIFGHPSWTEVFILWIKKCDKKLLVFSQQLIVWEGSHIA